MVNEAKFTLTLDGDSSGVAALFSAFKRQVRSDVSEIERLTNDVKLFGTLEADVKKSAQALDAARSAFKKLSDDALQAGPPTKQIAKDLDAAAKAAAAAERDLVKQSAALDKLSGSLTKAGVDVTNLANAEAKLAVEMKKAAAAAAEQEAKTATGFRTLKDIGPEINRIVAGYNALATSGKLTWGELSTLQGKAQQQINTLRNEVTGLGGAFSQVRGTIIGFAAAFAGVITAGAESAKNFRDFSTQIAAIGTIADVPKAKLDELSQQVRTLARTMGVDAVDSAKALYDIIGSGIPANNSIEVLTLATQAARAGLTDVHTAASVGVAILNGYGLQVDKLGDVYNLLFKVVADGVVTFPDLAKNIGSVIPIARAANVPLQELGAAFVVLTRQGIDAPEAATAIARAIQELASPAPEAAERMRELGIEFKGLFGTIQQFAARDFSLDAISKLIPETRAAKAVLALAQNFSLLREEVNALGQQSNALKLAYDRMAETPQARVDRFNASVKDLSFSVGEFVTNGTGFVETLTDITNRFNAMGNNSKQTVLGITALTVALGAMYVLVTRLAVPLNLLAGALASAGPAATLTAGGLTAATVAVGLLQGAIAGLLGFQLGKVLYEWSAAVRFVGDALGVSFAAFTNLENKIRSFVEGLRGNKAAADEAAAAYKRNAAIIRDDFGNAITGATERARQGEQANAALGDSLNKLSKAAADSATNVVKSVTGIVSSLDTLGKQIATNLTAAEAKLTSLVASLDRGQSDLTANVEGTLQQLEAVTARAVAALTSFDVQKQRDTIALLKVSFAERLTIVSKFADDSIALFEKESAARIQNAKKTQQPIEQVEREIAAARVAVLQTVVDKFRDHVAELLGIQRTSIENIRSIENERRTIADDVESAIRDIRRQGLDSYQQYHAKLRDIDELTAKARAALAAGENKIAEDYAKQAITLAKSVSGEVKDGETVVVASTTAQAIAIGKIQTASDLITKSLNDREKAERDAGNAASEELDRAIPKLERYEAQLKRVREEAAVAIKLKIEADEAAVTKVVAEVQKLMFDKYVTLSLKTELQDAKGELEKARDKLAAGIPVDIKPQLQNLTDALENVRSQFRDDKSNELRVNTDKALLDIVTLQGKVNDLGKAREATLTIKDNTDDVQGRINKLKEPTESTHTVHIKEVRDGGGTGTGTGTSGGDTPSLFNRGGRVGAFKRGGLVRAFARGGSVFPSMSGWRVPGSGNGDTVPRSLQTGSFVVRKAATRHYGDSLMGALAGVRHFAKGGEVTKKDVNEWAKESFGFEPFKDAVGPPTKAEQEQQGGGSQPFQGGGSKAAKPNNPDSYQDTKAAPINFDTRPIPEALLTAINVLRYAREMLQSVGQENPLLGSLLPNILQGINRVESNPNDKTVVTQLLQAAETIGANPYIFDMWGKTASSKINSAPIWFVDWLMKNGFLKPDGTVSGGKGIELDVGDVANNIFGKSITSDFVKKFFGNNPNKLVKQYQKAGFQFAGGGSANGSSTDTVRAMLTPGEAVIKRPAVQRWGTRFMDAVNSMTIPRAALARMLMPPVAHFAAGGIVGDTSVRPGRDPGGAYGSMTLNINAADAESILNPRNVRNYVVPVLNELLKNGRFDRKPD